MEYQNTVTVSNNFVLKSLPGLAPMAVYTVCAWQNFSWSVQARPFRHKTCIYFWEVVIPGITMA